MCSYCRKKINSFDTASYKGKEEVKYYLREQILMGKINKYSFPVLDYYLGSDEAEKLINAAATEEAKPKKETKVYYYNGRVYAISLAISIICFIATFIVFKSVDIKKAPYILIIPFISLFSMLVASTERKKKRK